jgi:hypothetical protein
VFYPVVTNDASGRYDRKNNLECILLSYPEPNSTYIVTVTPRSISKTQPYALVITGEVGQYPSSTSQTLITSGLTPMARLFVIVAVCVTCCFTSLVLWVGFANPARRRKLREQEEWGARY